MPNYIPEDAVRMIDVLHYLLKEQGRGSEWPLLLDDIISGKYGKLPGEQLKELIVRGFVIHHGVPSIFEVYNKRLKKTPTGFESPIQRLVVEYERAFMSSYYRHERELNLMDLAKQWGLHCTGVRDPFFSRLRDSINNTNASPVFYLEDIVSPITTSDLERFDRYSKMNPSKKDKFLTLFAIPE